MRIIIDSKIPFIQGALDEVAQVEYLSPEKITNDAVRSADALIIRTRTRCDERLLAGTKVRFIASATAGFDHIDTQYCKNHNIHWANAPRCNALAVTQYIASVLSFFIRRNHHLNPSTKTIGIVGVGEIGSRVEKLARQLGFKALLNDPPRARAEGDHNFVSLDKICTDADIITFHTPLTFDGIDKTYHLANKYFFDKLKRKQIIINTARGEIIDTKELTLHVKVRKISHLVIDCWENEPQVNKSLLTMATLATPHIAGYSADAKAKAAEQCVQAVSRFFDLNKDRWKAIDLPDIAYLSQLQQMKPDYFYLKTFDIEHESKILKFAPNSFEEQREKTALRREPKAYFNHINYNLIKQLGDFWQD
ncbi:MAG: 4-phosphoerythronate dehydrogenase [Prevotellaceae bacterium]|jgi:erythronate-4-phosphate dehydrogenase|nr:4-phosphoerythronate dehydrogenase [Prevotellaceae bacterium]